MARGSKKAEAQPKSSSSKRNSGRVALKEAGAKAGNGRKAAAARAQAELDFSEPRIFDDRTRRDIAGVLCGVVAVALFVIAVLPPSGFITSALSQGLHLGLGFGCYLLPIMMLATGVCMLVRTEHSHLGLRVGIGLFLILIALMSLLALFTPGAATDPYAVFSRDPAASVDPLAVRGGYIGAGIAWALLELFGQAVGCVLLIGVALGGVVIIGFSISGALSAIRDKGHDFREMRRERHAAEQEDDMTALDSQPYDQPRPERNRPFGGIRRSVDPDHTVEQAPYRPEPAARVPRDLSRPRRASQSITQVLGDSRTMYGGPHASDVDMYWPSDYAYDEGLAEAEEMQAAQAAKTRVLGVDEGPRMKKSSRARVNDGPADKTVALPWNDEADTPEAPVEEPKPMTRRLARKEDAPAAHAPAAQPAPKTRSLAQKPKLDDAPGETRGGFTLPAFSLIKHTSKAEKADENELREVAAELQGTLEDFSIMAQVVGWVAGPTVTLFKVDLPSGVRVSRILALQDDIALALAAPGVRIFAPIPGTNHVGIEVPNKVRQTVLLGDVLKDAKGGPLEMAIGKDVEGNTILVDLAKMPHLLIGGTTGSGKSVGINSMIMSILMRATPDEVRFIMIDPKRVEFTLYNGIPHLYVPVVTENKEAASALAWGVAEMERRLKVMSKAGVRNIAQYNAKVESGALDPDGPDESQPASGTKQLSIDDIPQAPKKMPYIVIVIDELADLMMNVGKEVELSISRIAQLARAAGIHMIIATQRPSTNVVTGLIKANITNRIAFLVASGIDSRVILDTPGAEKLIGWGDMLFSKPEWAKPQRLQGCFVSEDEIEAVVEHLKSQGEPEYHNEILQTNVIGIGSSMPDGSGGGSSSDDPLIWEAADIVVSSGLGSTSNIQRRLSVGYSRAGRIMDMLEEKGIVGPPNGSKPREVLVDAMELESLKAFEAHDAEDSVY
ncbi:DNA translocase FtsK [uncultured Slackia sp.]|uniref:FtsK/SpoIIIE family DNA translocase n=1 Tax=uncultured Slackia sp. TaxID=665903 RepID=UPI0026007A96|nr:DNA translocase FtsK [uncultured Slackia sp.]